VIFEVSRGYVWADLTTPQGSTVRVVTTHLESAWDPGTPPVSAEQARELATVLSQWSMPLVVTGDFNADPRDPRGSGEPNPGGQPDVTTGCAAQTADPSASTARPECNAYWTMVEAGFVDAGPDALAAGNRTWGASALLAGPDLDRLAEADGNPYGYTDRLDYFFTSGGVQVESVRLIGSEWPGGVDAWACDAPAQQENAAAAAAALGVPLEGPACLPTDHVGLLATLDVSAAATAPTSTDGDTVPSPVLPAIVALAAIVGLVGAAVLLWRHNR
jgi:endonuclease/exonuclease/phosphatase family metal-dependent hydrolase